MSARQRPTVLLLIPHLGGGGSERVIEALARSFDPAKYSIHLGLITAAGEKVKPFPSTVLVHQLRASRVRIGAFKLLRLVWQLKPDLIFSGISHLNLLVLALKPLLPRSTRIIVRQNGALRASLNCYPRSVSRRAHSLGYRRADRVICQSEPMAREIRRCLAVDQSRLLILPNPTNIARFRNHGLSKYEPVASLPTLLAVGRLVPEKGFDILLHAFASLLDLPISARLTIVGEGPEARGLQELSEALGVSDRIEFAGHVHDPVLRFRHASVFVLSSRTEGLPNAMLEAAAAGLPIVATPASLGITSLLRNRKGVWLASEITPNALRAAIEMALTSVGPGVRYPHAWIEPFDLCHAIPAYEAAIDQVLAETIS